MTVYLVYLSYYGAIHVLQPTFSADCGVQATTKNLYVHLVVITAERNPEEKQCLGTMFNVFMFKIKRFKKYSGCYCVGLL
ncbi:hypothetical protein T05_8475 [Trichinella murrelli]|uniref:Uncharacterized protein n=1 Tax=Trichinella murrelli TaxID=144512 RepID=A0A0V0TYA3_9BILA|nr:hypothetical protein T05_8475 [Trichinella murrelli]